MNRTANNSRMLGFAISTAMAGALLAGCASHSTPVASVSAEKAGPTLASGKVDKAVSHAESAVLASPQDTQYRVALGAAYMDAGRFASAVQAFDDAMTLGDESSRTQLSLALALIADGKNPEALAVLDGARDKIAPSDLGLAYALAGKPGHGIDILSIALRGGENTPKVRQNLAYTYALNGQWREARIMAAQDVPADQVGGRMEEWAATVHPQAYRTRVAVLLGVPSTAKDPGQPVALALNNAPSNEQLAAQAQQAALAAAEAADTVELAALAPEEVEIAESDVGSGDFIPLGDAPSYDLPAGKPAAEAKFDTAFAAPAASAPAKTAAVKAASAKTGAEKPIAKPSLATATGSHLVQLGAFSSEAGAKKAWDIYLKRYPELARHDLVISEAVVGGKRYWRVAASGFASNGAKSMCGKVKSGGKGCFAYAEGKPLPGAVATSTRLASR